MKITEYNILANAYMQDLVEEVRVAIGEGWQPLGGPFFLHDPLYPYPTTCQAMVKVEPEGGAAAWAEIARMMDANHKLELEIASMPS